MKTKKLYLVLFIISFGMSCDIKNNDIEPTETFAKIYDDNRFEQEYLPLDLVETSDLGFLILSEKKNDQSLFTSAFVMKVNSLGDIITSNDLLDPLGLPVNGWARIDNINYFVAMNTGSLEAQLIAVDDDGTASAPVPISGVTYPLASAQVDNTILLLSYDNLNAESVISIINTSGQIQQQASYSIGAGVDVEKPIIDHLTMNGPQLPFSVGKNSSGTYYFNGFYNYTFSMVFTSFGSSPTGVCQGQINEGGISAVYNITGDNYAITRFNFGANYLNPTVNISSNSTTSSTDLGGNTFPEIETDVRVKIIETTANQDLVYTTTTQSKRIVLYGFDKSSGEIRGTSYIGSGNPYTLSSIIETSDGGLAILAKTSLEGRFQRIALFKRDADYLNNLIAPN